MQVIELPVIEGKKIYFTSDFHLGSPTPQISSIREKKIIQWLDSIQPDCQAIFLMGDIFDFWFEYTHVAPKGFIRFLGKIAELSDNGIEITFFTGNHDMWMFDYLPKELGIKILRKPTLLKYNGLKLYLHHGDGLGPFDRNYKIIKAFFNSKICQRLFAFLHPYIGFSIATAWSSISRKANHKHDEVFLGEKEWLWQFAKTTENSEHFDYYLFGHRHLQMEIPVSKNSLYINLGEWFNSPHYFVLGEHQAQLININQGQLSHTH